MKRPPTGSTRTDTLLPDATLFRSGLRSLAARHNVDGKPNPTITKIADMFFAPPGRRDSQGIGRTYGEAVETHAQSRLNALARILEPFRSMRRAAAEQALMQIGRLIRSGKAVAGKRNIDNAAIAISKLLREELDYLRKAGVDEIGRAHV